MVRVEEDDGEALFLEMEVEVFPKSSRGFQTDPKILFGDREVFVGIKKVLESLLRIIQRKGFYLLTFLVEDEIATGFS